MRKARRTEVGRPRADSCRDGWVQERAITASRLVQVPWVARHAGAIVPSARQRPRGEHVKTSSKKATDDRCAEHRTRYRAPKRARRAPASARVGRATSGPTLHSSWLAPVGGAVAGPDAHGPSIATARASWPERVKGRLPANPLAAAPIGWRHRSAAPRSISRRSINISGRACRAPRSCGWWSTSTRTCASQHSSRATST